MASIIFYIDCCNEHTCNDPIASEESKTHQMTYCSRTRSF